MITRGIRELVSRDWTAAREGKDAYWAERIQRLGAIEAFRIADELRRQMQQHDPSWPDEDLRQRDIESHIRVAALFRRADSARCD